MRPSAPPRNSTPWGTITARLAPGDFHHVGDEGIVAFGLGRNTPPEASVLVRSGMVCTPFSQGEGWIGHHHVKAHQVVSLHQPGAVDGVAPLDACRIAGVEEHVHAGQGPCGAVHLLTKEGEVGGAHGLGRLDQQGARATDQVAAGSPGFPAEVTLGIRSCTRVLPWPRAWGP